MLAPDVHERLKRQRGEEQQGGGADAQDYVSVKDAARIFWVFLNKHFGDDDLDGVSLRHVYTEMCVELGKHVASRECLSLETPVDNVEQVGNESSNSPKQPCLLCGGLDVEPAAFARGCVVVCHPCADARKLHHVCLFDAAPGRNQEILVSMDDAGKSVNGAYNIGDGSSMSHLHEHLARGDIAGKTFVCATGDPRAPLIAFKEAVETGNGVLSAGGFSVHRWFAETMDGVLDGVTQPTR